MTKCAANDKSDGKDELKRNKNKTNIESILSLGFNAFHLNHQRSNDRPMLIIFETLECSCSLLTQLDLLPLTLYLTHSLPQ